MLQSFFYLSAMPFWDHCRKKKAVVRGRSWEQDQRVWPGVHAGHTDAWPGKQYSGSAPRKGAFSQLYQVTGWAAAGLGWETHLQE